MHIGLEQTDHSYFLMTAYQLDKFQAILVFELKDATVKLNISRTAPPRKRTGKYWQSNGGKWNVLRRGTVTVQKTEA